MTWKPIISILAWGFIFCGVAGEALAQITQAPTLSLDLTGPNGPESWTIGIRILFLLTALTLAPAFIMMVTSFTRVVIVLAILRQAMGTIHSPPNQVVVGLALFLTLFIMAPVWEQIQVRALEPYLKEEITQDKALEQAIQPFRAFMMNQVREKGNSQLEP